MAAAAGIAYEETLTGFKWIARAPGPGRRLLFGYEEALGYCVGDLVGDKDGVSALLALVRRVAALGGSGTALADRLDELARVHGLHATRQVSFRAAGIDGLARIAETMRRLRAAPPTVGRRAGGRAVRGPRRRRAGPHAAARATCWCCTSTAPASSCARAAPSRSSSATSRWSCPSPARSADARARADQALDEVAAAMTDPPRPLP